MHAYIAPPNSQGVPDRSTRKLTPILSSQFPLSRSVIQLNGRHHLALTLFVSLQRPMWWLQATTSGRIPSVTQACTTK